MDLVALHLGDFLLLLILQIESIGLVTGHGQFILACHLIAHSLVLEPVLLHLELASVLLGSCCLVIHLLTYADQRLLELFQGNLAVVV